MKAKVKKQSIELQETCSKCQLPITGGRKGSLTGWLFGGGQCKCRKAETGDSSASQDEKRAAEVSLKPVDNAPSDDEYKTYFKSANHNYEVMEEVGAGGMGLVYKVIDLQLNQVFALKVLRSDLAVDELAIERFAQEVRATQLLSHANIATVYDAGVDQTGRPFYVMEFVEGKTLREVLIEEGALSMERMLDITGQICEALTQAHQHGIIHRDLKPSNIILKKNESGIDLVKVVDFGIAKIIPPPGKDTMSLTKTGEIFGSPMYMSPEQCQGERLTPASDIYSLGCIMYECAAGRAPFQNTNPVKVILAHIYEKPLLPRTWRPSVIPDVVSDVVMNCLEKEPTIRYQSMDELKHDITRLANNATPKLSEQINRAEKKKALKWRLVKYAPLTALSFIVLVIGLWVADMPSTFNYLRAFGGDADEVEKLLRSPDKQNVPFVLLASSALSSIKGKNGPALQRSKASAKMFLERGDYNDCLYALVVWAQCESLAGNSAEAKKVAQQAIDVAAKAQFAKPMKGFRMIGWWYLSTADHWDRQVMMIGQIVRKHYPEYYADMLKRLDRKSLSLGFRNRLEMRAAQAMYESRRTKEARAFVLPLLDSWAKENRDSSELDDLAVLFYYTKDRQLLDKMAAFASTPIQQIVIALSDTMENKSAANVRFPKAFASTQEVRALASNLFDAGREADVDKLLQAAIAMKPDDAHLKLEYAEFLSGRGEKNKADQLRNEILSHGVKTNEGKPAPIDENLLRDLALSAYADGKTEEAKEAVEIIARQIRENFSEQKRMDPSLEWSRDRGIDPELALLALSIRQVEPSKAHATYDEIKAIDSLFGSREEGWAIVAKANLYLSENKIEEAEKLFNYDFKSGEADAADLAALSLGKYYESQERYAAAEGVLSKRISDIYASDSPANSKYLRALLAEAKAVYEQLGNNEKMSETDKRLQVFALSKSKEYQQMPTWGQLLSLSDLNGKQ